MTRLAMEANFQYVPIAPDVVPLIASLVAPAPATARFIDICAGEGEAAAHLASAWGVGRDQLYLNELADGRMARCTRFTQVSCAISLATSGEPTSASRVAQTRRSCLRMSTFHALSSPRSARVSRSPMFPTAVPASLLPGGP